MEMTEFVYLISW